jgi:hypothetical protein
MVPFLPLDVAFAVLGGVIVSNKLLKISFSISGCGQQYQ